MEKVVDFKYEYLPDFCYCCGIIGHTEKSCLSRARREGARQYGPDLRPIIYKGGSSEERSRSSSDKENFWLTNVAGNRGGKHGSDSPSWRKNTQWGKEEDEARKEEEKAVECPSKFSQDDQTGSKESEKLIFKDKSKTPDLFEGIENTDHVPKSESGRESGQRGVGEENLIHDGTIQVDKVKSQTLTSTTVGQVILDRKTMKGGKRQSQGTFKRYERSNGNKGQGQSFKTELKKRNVDLMELDLEAQIMKKARMDVDEVFAAIEKEEINNPEKKNAGLEGQPGEPK